jgi:hypothetical protein
VVNCIANASCQGAIVTCPEGYGCTVNCQAPGACNNLDLLCGNDGICQLSCSGNNCVGTLVQCGEDSCRANCSNTGQNVTFVAGSSCQPDDNCP